METHPSSLPRGGVRYFTGVRSSGTGVQLRSLGCTKPTMKLVGVQLSQPEMQNLVGVEISTLKSDWGALQEHKKGGISNELETKL